MLIGRARNSGGADGGRCRYCASTVNGVVAIVWSQSTVVLQVDEDPRQLIDACASASMSCCGAPLKAR